MTGQYDGKYLGKIKLLRERLEAISDDKGIYDFGPQIRNDFLSLAVMAVKNEIWRNKKDSVGQILKNVRSMCKDPQVQEAVEHHTMNQIGISVKALSLLYETCLCPALLSGYRNIFLILLWNICKNSESEETWIEN